MRNAFCRSLVIGLLAVGLAPQATRCQSNATTDKSAVIPLHAGKNAVDLLGTGRPGAIDVADRENYNAHGHHLALFQVRAPRYVGDPMSADEWQVVPFFASDTAAAEEIFHTVEGADCILRDLRILRGTAGRPVTVVIAERARTLVRGLGGGAIPVLRAPHERIGRSWISVVLLRADARGRGQATVLRCRRRVRSGAAPGADGTPSLGGAAMKRRISVPARVMSVDVENDRRGSYRMFVPTIWIQSSKAFE